MDLFVCRLILSFVDVLSAFKMRCVSNDWCLLIDEQIHNSKSIYNNWYKMSQKLMKNCIVRNSIFGKIVHKFTVAPFGICIFITEYNMFSETFIVDCSQKIYHIMQSSKNESNNIYFCFYIPYQHLVEIHCAGTFVYFDLMNACVRDLAELPIPMSPYERYREENDVDPNLRSTYLHRVVKSEHLTTNFNSDSFEIDVQSRSVKFYSKDENFRPWRVFHFPLLINVWIVMEKIIDSNVFRYTTFHFDDKKVNLEIVDIFETWKTNYFLDFAYDQETKTIKRFLFDDVKMQWLSKNFE